MGASVRTRLQAYMEPLFILGVSIYYLPVTLLLHPILFLTSPGAFRSKWFENFWNIVGPQMAASEIQVDHIEDLLSQARGTVLELGPGGGDQMFHYDPAEITRLYGAEPNIFLHARLVESAEKNGLGTKLITLEAGAQPGSLLPALQRAALIPSTTTTLPEQGIFDTIVAVKSLCSAPQTQLTATVAIIQALLKPGGEFLFFEHVANSTDSLTMSYAWFMDWIWPLFMGGCRLDGRLDKIVLGMGGWDERKITTVGDFQGHEVFRYVKGICRKA